MKLISETKFAGDTISIFRTPPDCFVKINGIDFGFYLSPEAGENAAQKHIMAELETKKATKS